MNSTNICQNVLNKTEEGNLQPIAPNSIITLPKTSTLYMTVFNELINLILLSCSLLSTILYCIRVLVTVSYSEVNI